MKSQIEELVIFDDGGDGLHYIGLDSSIRSVALARLIHLVNHIPQRLSQISVTSLRDERYDISDDPEKLFEGCSLPLISRNAVVSSGDIIRLKPPYFKPVDGFLYDGILSQHTFGNLAFKSGTLYLPIPDFVMTLFPNSLSLDEILESTNEGKIISKKTVNDIQEAVRELCYNYSNSALINMNLLDYFSGEDAKRRVGILALVGTICQYSMLEEYCNARGGYFRPYFYIPGMKRKGITFESMGENKREYIEYSIELTKEFYRKGAVMMLQHINLIKELLE